MKLTIRIKKEVDAKYLKVDAGVRNWSNGEVNGFEDGEEDEPKIPFAVKTGKFEYRWQPIIELETGRILNWPKGTTASVHYKVCDDGTYTILDESMQEIKKSDSYVPDIMCPAESGYGDYIIMDIDEDGVIADWECNEDLLMEVIKGDFDYEEDD